MDKGGSKMKKLLWGTILLALGIVVPIPTMAQIDIHINIPLPPPIVFAAPPGVIVLPDTDDVYVDPDLDVDLYFWNGWWWRPWQGRWYRSHYYDRGWGYYDNIPGFYFDVDPGWRGYYRNRDWHGHRWNYERIPERRLRQNWGTWHNDRHWERRGTWGVQNYRPRPQREREEFRQQREREYHQRPEVQRYERQYQQKPEVQRHEQDYEKRPEVRQEQQQRHEKPGVQRHEQDYEKRPEVRQEQRQREQPQDSQSQGRPEGGREEHRR